MNEFYIKLKPHTMKKVYLASICILLLPFCISAQVSNYVFTQSSGTYSTISGGTVFGNTTSDDQVFVDPLLPLGGFGGTNGPGIPIGFNFTFNSILFDRIGINNNGWIFFGQSGANPSVNSNSSNGYVGISATSTAPAPLQHRVAALSRDLQAQVGGDLRVETIGTAPNRVCVVQWNNYRKFAATGDNYNFQIRLNETSDVVEVAYGTFINNATTGFVEVGLRGATNTDFNNRSVPVTGNWATSTAGLTNNATAALNGTGLIPSSGQYYRWTPPSPCSSMPASNSAISSQSLICPNAGVQLSIASSYTNTGIIYQWFSSTLSAVGPFAAIPGATLSTVPSGSLLTNSYFNVAITCTVSAQTTTSSVQSVMIAGTTTNSVPYFEGFEGISLNNQLPNCSWSTTSPSLICQTYTAANGNNRIPRTGTKFASFRFGTNANGDYFYTNGIQLEPAITYSASMWYITDGLVGWQNLSMGIATTQAAASVTNIATLPGVPSGQFYQALTNTFVVQTAGIYYLSIRCVGSAGPQFLTFDDISITAPCSLNLPPLTIISSSSVICSNESIVLNAVGNGSHVWSNGGFGSSISVAPGSSTVISVSNTHSFLPCINNATFSITVLPTPPVTIFAPQSSVCVGSPITLYGFGATQYNWSTAQSGAAVVVSPVASTIYSVMGIWSINSCVNTATQAITVLNLPTILVSSSNQNALCTGESATLSVTGQNLVNYSWSSNNITINTSQAVVAPLLTTTYSVSATDIFGCTAKSTLTQIVSICAGVGESAELESLQLYPNPTSSHLKINGLKSGSSLKVTDMTGRIIAEHAGISGEFDLDFSQLNSGIYFINVNTNGAARTYKILRQ